MPRLSAILFALILLTACSNTSYEYKGEDGNITQKMTVPVVSNASSFEFTVVTNYALPLIESDYPTIQAQYNSSIRDLRHIKRLDIKLLVDGKEIAADSTEYSANYLDNTVQLNKEECCAMLVERLGLDMTQEMPSNSFSIDIRNKYKSLKALPAKITVILSANSDLGSTEFTRVLTLSSYQDRNFIRFH